MSNDDELEEVLNKLERRAGRLLGVSPGGMRESDGFGRLPSAIARNAVGPQVGDSVGDNYEVVDVLGRTDSSNVLLVRHKGVERQFAMKMLPHDLVRDTDRVDRFQEEARATSMIGHENIVFVTDFGRSERFGLYFVMEYLNGKTLSESIANGGPASIDSALNLAVCVGSALATVHELGIVHRDVRPENIMSHQGDPETEETWKLLDFGLSTQVVEREEAFGLFDEPLYVAPEIAAGDAVEAGADQFSLAAVLYFMLTGNPPWPGRTWTSAIPERWKAPPAPSSVRDDVGEFIDGVLLKALSPNPAKRFRSVEHFITSFQRASGRSRRPTIPPIDVGEAGRAAKGAYATAAVSFGHTMPKNAEVEALLEKRKDNDVQDVGDPPSLEISLDILPNMRPKITMDFMQADRLRREWRRNLVSGGIFVPTSRVMTAGTAVVVALRFAPTGQEASFPARIMAHADGNGGGPSGLAVELDPKLRDALHKFLFDLDLGLLDPRAVVRPLKALDPNANLSADEAFFLSRLSGPTPIGRLRGIFASLPIDMDDVATTLEEKGWVAIEGVKRPRLRSDVPKTAAVQSDPKREREEFVHATMQRADYFRSQGNFLAEIETLELAAQRSAVPEFLYRAALSRIQFLNDFAGAIASMSRACELEPNNAKYAKALYELERMNPRRR